MALISQQIAWWSRVERGALGVVFALAAIGCGGKGVEGNCPDLAACGGDPMGKWLAQSVCEFREPNAPQLAVPTPPAYNVPQTPALAAAPPNPNVSGEWCSGLVYLPPSAQANGKLGGAAFYARPFASTTTSLSLLANQTYAYSTVGASNEVTHFTRTCLNAYGANPSCAELKAALDEQQFANIVDMNCYDGAEASCDCSYTVTESGGPSGVWRANGGTLTLFPDTGAPPQPADFCVQGSTLTMSGKNGAHLLAAPGRRSMVMKKCLDPMCTQLAQ